MPTDQDNLPNWFWDWFWTDAELTMDPLKGPDDQYRAGAYDMLRVVMKRFPERMNVELPDLIEITPDIVRHTVEAYEALDASTRQGMSHFASAWTALANLMSDLATWHPHYNSDTGQIKDPRET